MGKAKLDTSSSAEPGSRRAAILDAAIKVFGRFGYRKTSIEDLAEAAQISKQGLYLHFASKDEIFIAALQKYLDDGLVLVDEALGHPRQSLFGRLLAAMDVWFGRHLETFARGSLDVIEAGDRMSAAEIERYKVAFRAKVARAMADSPEFQKAGNICSPKEIALVLFNYGLTWKEGHASRTDFMKQVQIGIKACCQLEP